MADFSSTPHIAPISQTPFPGRCSGTSPWGPASPGWSRIWGRLGTSSLSPSECSCGPAGEKSAQGACPSLGNVFLSLDTPPLHHCGKPLQKWWDLHPLIYVPSVGSKQGNTISSRHPSPSGTSPMWGPFSDPHSTANPPSHDGEGGGTPFRRPSPPRAAGPSVPLPSVVSHRASS